METHKICVNNNLIVSLSLMVAINLKYAHIFQEFEWAEEHCSNLDIHSNKLSRNCSLMLHDTRLPLALK